MGFTANYVISIQKGTWREGTFRGFLPGHTRLMRCYSGRVAQLVEQVTFNHWVTGSNPVALTILYGNKPLKALAFGGFFCLDTERVPKTTLKNCESNRSQLSCLDITL